MVKKLGFVVHSDKCIGCHSCEMACKNYYQQDPEIRWRKVYPIKEDAYQLPSRMYLSLACNHCTEPQCLKACPVNAYTKRDDGIVLHRQERCIGCRMCLLACPYNGPQYNANKKKVEKCHLCFNKIDNGEEPACVEGCVMEAIEVVDFNSFDQFGTVDQIEGFPDPKITKPSVRFVKPKIGLQVRRD